jgi:hypothetical protein
MRIVDRSDSLTSLSTESTTISDDNNNTCFPNYRLNERCEMFFNLKPTQGKSEIVVENDNNDDNNNEFVDITEIIKKYNLLRRVLIEIINWNIKKINITAKYLNDNNVAEITDKKINIISVVEFKPLVIQTVFYPHKNLLNLLDVLQKKIEETYVILERIKKLDIKYQSFEEIEKEIMDKLNLK